MAMITKPLQQRFNANTLTYSGLAALLASVLSGCGDADSGGGKGTPSDTADFSKSTAAVNVNLTTMTATGGSAKGYDLTAIKNITGSQYDDHLTGNTYNNILMGNAGADTLTGVTGTDTTDAYSGTLSILGGNNMASYSSSPAAVTVNLTTGTGVGGDAQGDTLINIQGIIGSAYHDILTGDDKMNSFKGSAGGDEINGGAEKDAVWYDESSTAVTVNLTEGTGVGGNADGDKLTNIENIFGSAHDDILTGDENTNYIDAGAGNDILYGYGKNDALIGKEGNDTLHGGDGDDIIAGNDGIDALYGDAGDDELSGGANNDSLDGGPGNNDQAKYDESPAAVTVNLTTGTGVGGYAEGDTLTNIEVIWGSSYDDTLTGDDQDNGFIGDAGADTIDGKEGSDLAYYDTSPEAVTVNLKDGTGSGGDAEGDTLKSIENIWGSNHNDNLTGNQQDNDLTGWAGDDILTGNAGNDDLEGGKGSNTYTGNDGVDTFTVFIDDKIGSNYDTITDFTVGANGDALNFDNDNPDWDSSNLRGTNIQKVALTSSIILDDDTGLLVNMTANTNPVETDWQDISLQNGDKLYYLKSNGTDATLSFIDAGENGTVETSEVSTVALFNDITAEDLNNITSNNLVIEELE